jgi:hypothetical protein
MGGVEGIENVLIRNPIAGMSGTIDCDMATYTNVLRA